jgi:hypothetical protein
VTKIPKNDWVEKHKAIDKQHKFDRDFPKGKPNVPDTPKKEKP